MQLAMMVLQLCMRQAFLGGGGSGPLISHTWTVKVSVWGRVTPKCTVTSRALVVCLPSFILSLLLTFSVVRVHNFDPSVVWPFIRHVFSTTLLLDTHSTVWVAIVEWYYEWKAAGRDLLELDEFIQKAGTVSWVTRPWTLFVYDLTLWRSHCHVGTLGLYKSSALSVRMPRTRDVKS